MGRTGSLFVAAIVITAFVGSFVRYGRYAVAEDKQAGTSLVDSDSKFVVVAHTLPHGDKWLGVVLAEALRGNALPQREDSATAPALADDWKTKGLTGPLVQMPLGDIVDCRSCRHFVGDSTKEKVAAVYATTQFALSALPQKPVSFRLRVQFHDGLIVWLNGKQVVRRNIGQGASPYVAASKGRGPETESFYFTVSPQHLQKSNVLAIEVRPSFGRRIPELTCQLDRLDSPVLVTGPVLQRVDTTSAMVRFSVDRPVVAAIVFDKKDAAPVEAGKISVQGGNKLARHHDITISGLPKGTSSYRLILDQKEVGTYSVTTAPLEGEPVRFAVYGDMRGGHEVHKQIIGHIRQEKPSFVLNTGDLVLRGSDRGDWQKFFAVTGPLLAEVPYYPTIGNHDVGRSGDEGKDFGDVFALWPGPARRPSGAFWYSFGVGDLHFVMLDSNRYRDAKQKRWLDKDLAQAKTKKKAVFVLTHDGPYSRGAHRGNVWAAKHMAPILRKHKVDWLFSGHDHLYQRGRMRGLPYIVTGGGGAPLYSVSCGNKGQRRCAKDGMQFVKRAYHYLMVEVTTNTITVCPKYPDGSLLEPCVKTARRLGL